MVPDFSPAQSAQAECASLHWGTLGSCAAPLSLGLTCAEWACPLLQPPHGANEGMEETAQRDSSSFKQTTPIPATGQSCTLMAKGINRPQQFEAMGALSAGLLFLSGNGGCIQGFNLNMVTSYLHGCMLV